MPVLKKLFPYIWVHKGKFGLVILFGALMSVTDTGVAILAKYLFDEVFTKKDPYAASIIPLIIPALYFVHGGARFGHMYWLKVIGELVITRLQKELQVKYMRLNLSYYTTSNSGAMISKTINDVQTVKEGIATFAEVIREPITITLLMGWLIYLDWKLTLAILIIGPFIAGIINKLAKSVRKYSHKQQESMEIFTSTLKETVDGIRIIQSFNLSDEMKDRLQRVIDTYIGIRKKIIARQEGSGPITEFLAACMLGGVFYYMGQQIILGQATGGDVLSYFVALGYVQQPVKKLLDGIMRLQPTIASSDRIFSVLEDRSVVPEVSHPENFPTDWKTIEFKDVSFAYGSDLVLKNINLTIKRGEVIALVGESGSGKSTLVNLLERFYDPTHGEILIDGVPIRQLRLSELRDNISLVTQDVFLFNDTIETNIRSGNFKHEHFSVIDAAKMANAHDFIENHLGGYQVNVGDRGGRLSGGEKQRISIARAIYKNAPILILDEATSALDSASEVEVQKGLDRLMMGRTAFVVAHRLSTIMNADRILVFKRGQIVEQGTHESLLQSKGQYYQFHQLQTQK